MDNKIDSQQIEVLQNLYEALTSDYEKSRELDKQDDGCQDLFKGWEKSTDVTIELWFCSQTQCIKLEQEVERAQQERKEQAEGREAGEQEGEAPLG